MCDRSNHHRTADTRCPVTCGTCGKCFMFYLSCWSHDQIIICYDIPPMQNQLKEDKVEQLKQTQNSRYYGLVYGV